MPIETQSRLPVDIDQLVKFIWGETRIAITILKKQKMVVGLRLIKQLILKAVWYWQVDRHIDQWYRREKPERDSDTYTTYNWFFQKGKKQFM